MYPDYSGPTGYEQLARAVETAYAEGYADGWLRGYQEGHYDQEQRQHRPPPAPERVTDQTPAEESTSG